MSLWTELALAVVISADRLIIPLYTVCVCVICVWSESNASLVCTRFSPSHVDWLKQRKQRLIVTGSWRNSWDGTCHFDCTSSQCAAVRTLRSGPVCACVRWAFKLHTFCSEHGICHISLVIAEFSMFWDYIHAPGTKHGHRVFPGAPTASPPIRTFGKMSDADNWPLSWLQTSLLTMWENVTSHFSLSHQNILHQNQEDFNTHSSNKHGDRISRDGLSVWGGCVWLSLTSFKPGLSVIYPFIHKSRTSAAIHHQYTAEDMQSCVTYTQAWSIVNQLRLVQIKPTAQKDQIKSVQNAKDYKRWHRPRGLISGVQTGIERQLEVRLADTCISPT